MKFFLLALLLCSSAQASFASYSDEDCKLLIEKADKYNLPEVYDACGLNNKDTAQKWETFARRKQLKKILFHLYSLNPDDALSLTTCKRSADLGYEPALLALGEKAEKENNPNRAIELYRKIIQNSPAPEVILSEEDKAIREALYRLSVLLIKQGKAQEAVPYLQQSARLQHRESEKLLGTFLFFGIGGFKRNISEGEKYLFRAILKKCPTAEELLSLPLREQQGNLTKQEKELLIQKSLFTCDASSEVSVNTTFSPQKTKKECRCHTLTDKTKLPYRFITGSPTEAFIMNKEGAIVKVKANTSLPDGFIITDVGEQGIILKSDYQRQVLVKEQNEECQQVCFENLGRIEAYVDRPYRISFTPYECRQLAYFADRYASEEDDFYGKKECHFENRTLWSNYFKEKGYAKLLYLQKNLSGDYPSGKFKKVELLAQQNFEQNVVQISKLLSELAGLKPTDKTMYQVKQKAFCAKTLMHMTGRFRNGELALAWNKKGIENNFPEAYNFMGIQYAEGFGTERDTKKAAEYFRKAEELSDIPFIEAHNNLKALEKDGYLKSPAYGKCSDKTPPSLNQILTIFKEETK